MMGALDRIATVQDEHTQRFERIEADLKGLRADLPGLLAEAVREGLKGR